MSNQNFECPECGAAMHIDEEKTLFFCQYCGNTEPLDEVTASRLNAQDAKEVELERIKLEREVEARRARERAEAAARAEKQRKNKAIQQGLSSASRKITRIIIGIIALIFIVGFIGVAFEVFEDANYEKELQERFEQGYTWPTSGLGALIDEPAFEKGYI